MPPHTSRVPEVLVAVSGLVDDPAATLEALGALFRAGTTAAPSGRYHGEVVAVRPYTLPECIAGVVARYWMPWQGKIFNEVGATGENIVDARFGGLVKALMPAYKGFTPDTSRRSHVKTGASLRGLRFRICVEPSLFEPDTSVIVVDYNIPENPLPVRAGRDEIVALPSGGYLGKACLVTRRHPDDAPPSLAGRPWHWHMVAYFALSPSTPPLDRESPRFGLLGVSQ